MCEYVVEAKSREELRKLANVVRDKFGFHKCIYFPIVKFLELMCFVFEEFSYEIVPDSTFPSGVHADTDVLKRHIRIKESVYNGAVEGNGRDRMTIAHEIAHFFTLCFCGFSFERNFDKKHVPAYKSPEWQAKCFAGELMIPAHLIKDMSPTEIQEKCGVSPKAARYQYNILHNVR